MIRGVTFDFGQTLAELDSDFLAARLVERGHLAKSADLRDWAERFDRNIAPAMGAYGRAVAAGISGHPWHLMVSELLRLSAFDESQIVPAVDWLWNEQLTKNLWRRPIVGMIELVRDLALANIPVGVVSNSEGKLAELAEELGWRSLFCAFADSGVLKLEKPGREIFAWTAEKMALPIESIVHVGDSFAADVVGATNAGQHAILFGPPSSQPLPPRAAYARNAAEVRAHLVQLMGVSL